MKITDNITESLLMTKETEALEPLLLAAMPEYFRRPADLQL